MVRKQLGFTLIEVLIVLVIISLLTAYMAPGIQQSYNQFRLDAVIVQLHNDIRWAQQLADQEQKSVTIHFLRETNNNQYGIVVSGSPTYSRKRKLPNDLTYLKAQSIVIEPDKTFRKNGHILLQKGDICRYVYYYQTGRSRVTAVSE